MKYIVIPIVNFICNILLIPIILIGLIIAVVISILNIIWEFNFKLDWKLSDDNSTIKDWWKEIISLITQTTKQ